MMLLKLYIIVENLRGPSIPLIGALINFMLKVNIDYKLKIQFYYYMVLVYKYIVAYNKYNN